MIKEILEQTVRDLEVRKEREIATAKERVVREKIAPYNAGLDNSRAKALQELDAELNAKIAEVQKQYEDKKQSLVALGEQEKQKHSDTVFATELALVSVEFDKHINKLKAQIAEIEG